MFSRSVYLIARHNLKTQAVRLKHDVPGKQLQEMFFDTKIQDLLKKISNIELDKVFYSRKLGQKLRSPKYKFMTTEEVEEAQKKAEKRSNTWTQMPPVLGAREEINKVISEDPELDGHDYNHSKIIFTDISFGLSEEERLIVVREPSGTLRSAHWNERQRMNQIFSPRPGRELETPKMFEPEHLQKLLEKGEYKFILDRACAQFEPDDPEYIRVTTATYNKVNEERHFNKLLSTRHFGPMAFHLVLHCEVDNLLLDSLQTLRLEDAVSLVHLHHMIHPDCASAQASLNLTDHHILRSYIQMDSRKRGLLEVALQSCLELIEQKKQVEEGIKRAHGVTS